MNDLDPLEMLIILDTKISLSSIFKYMGNLFEFNLIAILGNGPFISKIRLMSFKSNVFSFQKGRWTIKWFWVRIYVVLYQSKIIRKIIIGKIISIGPFTSADCIPDKYNAVSYINSKAAGALSTNTVILKTLRILNSFFIYPTTELRREKRGGVFASFPAIGYKPIFITIFVLFFAKRKN